MPITQAIFEAFLRCPSKAYLLSQTTAGDAAAVGEQQEMEQRYRHEGTHRVRSAIAADEVYIGTPSASIIRQRRYRMILGCTLRTTESVAELHGLDLQGAKHNDYHPFRFVSNEKLTNIDKLLLAFDALVLSQIVGSLPRAGKLIHGRNYATTNVSLAGLFTKVRSAIAAITAQQASPTPPPVVLNQHCPECLHKSRCSLIAEQADDLSRLTKMSTKERKNYHEKGIFTVTQLSYSFRPRRYGKTVRHDHALKALAIRKNQVHVVGDVAFTSTGTPVYFDVEGDPDRELYYCIGLRLDLAGTVIQHSFWADTPEDEKEMWAACLQTLATINDGRLIHYGSYETTFLRQMNKRYPDVGPTGIADQLIARAVNLITVIYGHVYFPTYSNGLKDIARYLGFRWSELTASGFMALRWRRQWELTRSSEVKQQLVKYNMEDCAAAQTVAKALLALAQSADTKGTDVVDVTTQKRDYPQLFGKIDFALPEFEQINAAARWDHQREKIYVRSNKRLKRLRHQASKRTSSVGINRIVNCEEPRPTCCDACGATTIYRFGRLSHVVYDLKLTANGIKRWVVRYSFPRYMCRRCKTTFHRQMYQGKYGNTICSYIVYQIIELQLAQNVVGKSMEQLFRIPASRGMINRLKAGTADRYEDTYQRILEKIVAGKLVHADETRATVGGKAAYVWVFTSLEEVAFVYSESREASTPQEILQDFHGVLVSDFYAGYDGIPCPQQKCLIHLMRDINEDLTKQPFNDEIKQLAKEFADLLRTIVDSVERFGLKSRHLRKHHTDVDRFFASLSQHDYQTEVATGYRRRFEKNRDRLFTFLDHDGVPWNNNNAEHAIKAFARLRNIIGGSSTAKGLREYLMLLSISETCKCKGVRFLDFLLSKESDVDHLAQHSAGGARHTGASRPGVARSIPTLP